MAIVKLARHAMATRFEIVLLGDNLVSLRAAGEEALDEIDRLESQLSLFKPTSEIAHLNALAAREPVRVTPGLFTLLEHARRLTEETGGAFDITIAPLVRCWGFMGSSGHVPRAEDVAAARTVVGMHLVELNRSEFTVRFSREGVMLDLGAIGKGYAIERAVELLREAGVTNALLHGGTSTVYGLGRPPDADGWRIEITSPRMTDEAGSPRFLLSASQRVEAKHEPVAQPLDPREGPLPFATVSLKDESLSVSAVWGKSFHAQGRSFGHIIDPRTGEPATRAVLSAVVLPSATETDALSTALLTLGPPGHDRIANLRPDMRTLVVGEANGQFCVNARGIVVSSLPELQ
jgi:thiamine biosynthesis lipoprotein